jgi:hypothetical protein
LARAALAAAAAITLAMIPRVARADVAIELVLSPGMTWTRDMPALTSEPVSTASRDIPKQSIATRGSLASIGGYADTQITFGDRTTMPLFGFGIYGAVGSYDSVTTSADGSIARLRPWTTMRYDLLLPGVGARFKKRRWMVEVGVRTGVSWLAMHGSVADGADTQRIDPSGASFLLVGAVSGCRRLDPFQRLCVEIAPRLYDFGFLNGATVGLRYEWGM